MSFDHDDQQSSSSYRSEILERLEHREKKQRSVQTLFRHYAALADQLNRLRKVRTTSESAGSFDDLSSLKEEISNVYKLKSKNDQDLIEANRKLIETETKLNFITSQRDKFKSDSTTLAKRVAELEKEVADLQENNSAVNMERIALLASCNTLTAQKTELENERYQLLNKIRELQEKRAEFMNAEVALQEERAQLKMREQIAKASEDITYDDRASTAFGCSPETSDEYMMTDIIPGAMRFRITAHDGEVNDIEWFTEDTFATAGSDNKIRVWRVSPSKNEAAKIGSLTGCNGPITRLDYDPERRACLASSVDKTCRIWNVDSQRLLHTFSGHTDKVASARFIQSHHVISGSADRTIRYWDVSNLRCVKSYFVGSTVFDLIAKCGVSQQSFVSAHFDKKIRFWDSRSSDPIRTLELGHRVTSLDISMDGLQLLASCRDDTLSMLDVRTFAILHLYSSENYRTSCDNNRAIFSPTNEFVAAGSANGSIFVWNTKTTRLEKVLRTGKNDSSNAILSLSWNQSGRGLLACDKQKTCSLWR